MNDDPSEILELLFQQAQMQSGGAVTNRWLHDRDDCPGCGGEITETKMKGKNLLSMNAFIYREHRVLIAYFLCGKCAKKIFKSAERNPGGKTPLHGRIEENLKSAFVRHLGH